MAQDFGFSPRVSGGVGGCPGAGDPPEQMARISVEQMAQDFGFGARRLRCLGRAPPPSKWHFGFSPRVSGGPGFRIGCPGSGRPQQMAQDFGFSLRRCLGAGAPVSGGVRGCPGGVRGCPGGVRGVRACPRILNAKILKPKSQNLKP